MSNKNTGFTLDNIPFGIFSTKNRAKRLATIIGDHIVDLFALAQLGAFDDLNIKKSVFRNDFLNDFIALGKTKTDAVRLRLQVVLADYLLEQGGNSTLNLPSDTLNLENRTSSIVHRTSKDPSVYRAKKAVFYPKDAVNLHLPVKIGDYTDFYSSEQHATNVGMMFRDAANALLPNWKHIPVAYHGRASSIFVSGTNFHRPKGQICPDETQPPIFSATRRLDIELEMATIIGRSNPLGDAIPVDEAEDYAFGFLLFNDWSARDIQKWEYVPLGPFLAKNFFSTVSPWVVTTAALAAFRVPVAEQVPAVLPYLAEKERQNFDIQLEVALIPQFDPKNAIYTEGSSFELKIKNEELNTQNTVSDAQNVFYTEGSSFELKTSLRGTKQTNEELNTSNAQNPIYTEETVICRSNFKNMYWTVAQQIAHHTVNGCNLNVGDVLGSGTISGTEPDSFGSLLELTWGGKNAITLADGITTRRFVEDGDTVVIRGFAERNGIRIDFGEVRTTVLAAK
jgi:fumarylacetoacetase